MDVMNIVESLFRWAHVVAGITWIGLLYFFNWVNSAFAPTMDAETKQKVLPELLPRALYWFRWGAAFTWFTGVFLLLIVYYHSKIAFEGGVANWTNGALVMVVLTFAGVHIYDLLYKKLKNPQVGFVLGVLASAGMLYAYQHWAGFSFRGYAIHLGTFFGTCMAFNVWFRIWPAQKKIITAIKNGEKPDADLTALAGLRSKHNTYMSVPLVFLMIAQHATWAASWMHLSAIVLVGWLVCFWLYKKAKTVPGF